MFIKPLYDKEEYDVFLGQGWENWVRVKAIPRDRTVTVLAKSEHVNVTDGLKQAIFFRTRKESDSSRNDVRNSKPSGKVQE